MSRYRLYRARHVASRYDEFVRISHASLFSVVGIAVVGFTFKLYVARGWIAITLPLAIASLSAERAFARDVFARLRRSGRLLRPAVVVGANTEGVAIASMLECDPSLGYKLTGFADDVLEAGTHVLGGHTVLGGVEQIADIVAQVGATAVVMATTAIDAGTSNRLARMLTDLGISVELSSSLCDIAAERLIVRPLGRYPVIYVEPVSRNRWRMAAKRTFDVVVAGLGLLASMPLLVLAGVAIKATSRGTLFFKQDRVGRDGRTFRVVKFRTMVSNAEELLVHLRHRNEADGPLFKIREDPRVTRVGRFLRRSSIDELPQLWNVLRGEMTLVGPRPAIPAEVDGWSPELHQRLRVKPGITGMWQVSGRSQSSFDDYVRLDLYYVDNWSLLTDLAILLRTIPSVFLQRGAC
jgi:exopolysaccharide biosynthesis polyprenyl glycosylphosphotransferase